MIVSPKAPSASPGCAGRLGLSVGATGVLLGLLAPLLWSSSGMFVKILSLEALPLAGLRALIAGVALAPFLRLAGVRINGALLVLLAAYTVSVLGYVSAVKLTTAANAIALVSTAPAWVLLLSWAVERRVTWPLAWPVLLILAGVGALLLEQAVGRSVEGNLLALLAGMGFGLFTFFLPRVNLAGPGLVSLCNLVAAAVILPFGAFALDAQRIAVWEWASLLYLGVVQIGLATICFAGALRRIPPTQASVLALLEPLLAPLWVYLAIGERPSAYGAAGFAFILTGILTDFGIRRRGWAG